MARAMARGWGDPGVPVFRLIPDTPRAGVRAAFQDATDAVVDSGSR